MFRSPLKPSSGGPLSYFARLLNWNLLIYICYKECRYVAVCQVIPSGCVCVCVCVCGGGGGGGTSLVETMLWNSNSVT